MTSSNNCPFLQEDTRTGPSLQTVEAADASGKPHLCHAVVTPFAPSVVHQSSCCSNPANFVRCPYYVEAMGQPKKQVALSAQEETSPSWLRQQLDRVFPFGRSERKKRKRIYISI